MNRDVNLETYEEEGHTLETANPHLRGLLDWVEATTQSMNAVLTSANSSKTHNARTLLHSEVDLPDGDLSFMETLLARAELMPSSNSDQCIATLEVVSKWLRALCNLYEKLIGSLHYSAQSEDGNRVSGDLRSRSNDSANVRIRRTSSLGEARMSYRRDASSHVSPGSGTSPGPSANDLLYFGPLSGRRIDRVYDNCDEILQELLINTSTALGSNYRKLLSINTPAAARRPSGASVGSNVSAKYSEKYGDASPAGSTWLTQMGMIAVKDPMQFTSTTSQPTLQRTISAPSDDDNLVAETVRLSSQLISLYRLQINMLEVRVHMYNAYELVACLELLEKLAEELGKVTGTLFAALKRVLPSKERCSPEQAAQRTHLDGLTSVAQELLGCCFAIKVFAVCGVSPINFQALPEHCQRISQTALDIGRLSSYDAPGSASEDSNNFFYGPSDSASRAGLATGSPSQKAPSSVMARTYNVIYELTLGTHFLELMLTLPSPSVVRSKMYLAVYTYLLHLKKKQLPWQNQKYKLVSLKQHLDSFANIFNLYQGADAFGLNYNDLDNNSFTLTLAEVEVSIVQSFGEVFGALDQARILQLLLYESAVELLPTAPHDVGTGPAAFLQPKTRRPSSHQQQLSQGQHLSYQHSAKSHVSSHHGSHLHRGDSGNYPDNTESEAPSELSQPGVDRVWVVFSSMRGAFRHFSPALNLDKSLEMDRRLWDMTPADSPLAPSVVSGRAGGEYSPATRSQRIQEDKRLLDRAPTRPKLRNVLSYSCRYELFNFSHHILYRLAQAIAEMSPNVALDLYQLCVLALGHLRHTDEKNRVEKIAVMLAVKVGRRDAAIWHGESVLRSLQRHSDNINEMLYLTDLLAAQYSENAQYELAAKTLFSAISALNNHNKRDDGGDFLSAQAYSPGSSRRESEKATALVLAGAVTSGSEFERTLDPLLLKLGNLLLRFGCPDRAADTFQVLLSSLCERTDCLANDAKKVTVLSWLAEAYLELEQYDTCAAVIRAIKEVRALKLHKAVTAAVRPRQNVKPRLQRKPSQGGRNNGSSIGRSLSRLATPSSLMSRSHSERRLHTDSKDYGIESPRLGEANNMRGIELRAGIAAQSSDSFDLNDNGPRGVTVAETALASTSGGAAATGERSKQSAKAALLDSTSSDAARPLPQIPPSTRTLQRQSSGQLRARPLPPTPRTTATMPKTPAAEAGGEPGVLYTRPLPPTPLDLSTMRNHSAQGAGYYGGVMDTPRETPRETLRETSREVQTPRDTPRDTPRETPIGTPRGTPRSTPRGTPRESPKGTPRENVGVTSPLPNSGEGGSQKAPPATLHRTNSKRQRKAHLLKNLQPLEVSNNNLTATSEGNTPPYSLGATSGLGSAQLSTASSPFGAVAPGELSPLSTVLAQQPRHPAVNSIYTHYVRNPPEANLPQYCATVDDLDLGRLKARLLLKSNKHVSALRALLPTIMAVEISLVGRLEVSAGINNPVSTGWAAGMQSLSRQALMELGELYYLRGKIQLEAAKSCADVAFPFQVGSTDLFEKVASLLPTMPGTTQAVATGTTTGANAAVGSNVSVASSARTAKKPTTGVRSAEHRRFAKGQRRTRTRVVDLPSVAATTAATATGPVVPKERLLEGSGKSNVSTGPSVTTREPRVYNSAADLCWDAMKWFHRAREVAKLAGDEIGGALAANCLAMCHLLPTFVPTALFRVPLERSADLSSMAPLGLGADSKGRQKQHKASLREVQNTMEWALEVHSQTCLPLPLMDTYLNLAEMCHLMGNADDAVALWSEAKELFLMLFADGTLVPLVRRGSAKFVRRIQHFVDRLVRFMFVLDKATFNGCLHLLDTQILLGHEAERMTRRNKAKADAVSAWLPDVLQRLVSGESNSREVSIRQTQFTLSSKSKKDKRKTVSRLSRFFVRLFRSTSEAPSVDASVFTGTASPISPPTENPSAGPSAAASAANSTRLPPPVAGNNSAVASPSPDERGCAALPLEREMSGNGSSKRLSRDQSSPKPTNTFDSFIERSGFTAQLDMRRFYNIMNADLVAEKVLDFGWSDLVDYEALLSQVDPSVSANASARITSLDAAIRHISDSSQSTAFAQYTTVATSGGGMISAMNVDVLIHLNLRAKVDCALKYRRLAAASYLHEHILRRTQLLDVAEDGTEHWHADLASLAVDTSGNISPSKEAAAVASLFRTSSMHVSACSPATTPRSPKSPKSQSFSGYPTSLSPRKTAVLNMAKHHVTLHGSNGAYELPIDPFADFDWMGESFADYTPHGRSLQVRAIVDRMQGITGTGSGYQSGYSSGQNNAPYLKKHRRVAMGSDAAQFNALFMPEFDEAHQVTAEQVQHRAAMQQPHHQRDATGSSGFETVVDSSIAGTTGTTTRATSGKAGLSVPFTAEYLRSIDDRAETVLIQRAWRCYLLLQNAQKGYRSAERSMSHVRHEVRGALCNLALNMVRLRAFSRQYQHSLLDYDKLQSDLPGLPGTTSAGGRADTRSFEAIRAALETELMMLRNTAASSDHIREVRAALRECRAKQAVMLSQRLPYVIYTIHVSITACGVLKSVEIFPYASRG
jgi:hypothetical protein